MTKSIELNKQKIEEWMWVLLNRSHKLGLEGEIPVCAVILDNEGKCIGHGFNNREKDRNRLGHAELVALKQASLIKNDWRFNECTLIVTLEPCPMCAGALIQSRMGKVIYGAHDKKRGALGGTIDLSKHKSCHHIMKVEGGVLSNQASNQLESWFKGLRKRST